MATSLHSRKFWGKGEICKKNQEIRKNPFKSQACYVSFGFSHNHSKKYHWEHRLPWYMLTNCTGKQKCISGVLSDKSNKSWKIGIRPGSPFGLEDKAPEPPACLILEDSKDSDIFHSYILKHCKLTEIMRTFWKPPESNSFFFLSFLSLLRTYNVTPEDQTSTLNPEKHSMPLAISGGWKAGEPWLVRHVSSSVYKSSNWNQKEKLAYSKSFHFQHALLGFSFPTSKSTNSQAFLLL